VSGAIGGPFFQVEGIVTMPPKVEEICRFPVKGARGQRPDSLDVNPAVGVVGDRRFAIKRNGRQSEGWAPKIHFRVCMNTPAMAVQTPEFSGGAPDSAWLKTVATTIGETEVTTVDTKNRFNMVDTDPHEFGPTISFLNLASVRALAAETGWMIDPDRFRMNIWYDDGKPFSELAWADAYPGTREFMVGHLRLRVQDACERCQAIEANPATGQRDLPVLEALAALLKKRGYGGSPQRGVFEVMGFLATPLGTETITRGQEIRLL
jgi:MOSC domain-containing protein